MSRLLAAVSSAGGHAAVEQALTCELRGFSGAAAAVLMAVDESSGSAWRAALDPDSEAPPTAPLELDRLAAIADALTAEMAIRLDGDEARLLGRQIGLPETETDAATLLLPLRPPNAPHPYVLVLAGAAVRTLTVEDVEAAAAFLAAAGESLGQAALLEQGAREAERHSALARAAKALNESLDLTRVLPRICEEAAAILTADAVAVYRGGAGSVLVLEAAHPDGEDAGAQVAAGAGIAARAVALGRSVLARDVQDGKQIRSALAVPMRWDGETRGVLCVGFKEPGGATERDLTLLESFAELAAVACRNASVHAGLAEAARTDGLTGCLNHAALHETLRREMQRCRRTGRRLSIVLVDLDHFKEVNERHGHLVGDEVLRRVGRAMREAVRPYDFVARYGGDEFAIVAVDAHEDRAAEIGERSIARLGAGLGDVLGDPAGGPHATAGVAEWTGEASPSDLVREADRALLFGKQQGVRGQAVRASEVPGNFALGRPFGDAESTAPETVPGAGWPSAVREETESLRTRTRQLTLANALGARLAAMTRVEHVFEVASKELEDAFGYMLRPGDDGSDLSVPIWVGSESWGSLDVGGDALAGGFEDADRRLLEAVADQLGAALHSAALYEQLERAYLDTAEALGAALEAKDAHAPEHARSIVRNAEAVGRRLGMSADELRDLRYAAAFHDIGKVAVPERILNKPGPLTESERREVERHAVVGAQILQEVDFLAGVLPLVRHCHEHWDGGGYPDGLAGDRIPLGARVILVCDAHDAMTADRPYRRALAPDVARAEIRSAAGRQFDSRVASAFLDSLGGHPAPVH